MNGTTSFKHQNTPLVDRVDPDQHLESKVELCHQQLLVDIYFEPRFSIFLA